MIYTGVKCFHQEYGGDFMEFISKIIQFITKIFYGAYDLLWGNLFTITFPGGSSIGISLMILMLIPAGIYFTIRTKCLPVRCFPEMLRISTEKQQKSK